MSHMTARSSYEQLINRLNRAPQGAPGSDTLFQILKILFSESEAKLVSLLPIKPFTAKVAAKNWKKSPKEAKSILDDLASKALILDVGEEDGSETQYVLPPPMAGFFEFALMRIKPGDEDQKTLAKLLYHYINVEEDFVKSLFDGSETAIARTFVNEPVLSSDNAIHILDYERASHIIKTASHIGVGACYCRHKMQHMGKNCGAPIEDFCLTLNSTAHSLIKYGHIREVTPKEALKILDKAYELDLVQCGENVQKGVNFICNCCGCCCEALIAARKVGFDRSVFTTNFIPKVDDDLCNGCGKCVNVCPMEAMTLVSKNCSKNIKAKKAKVDERSCLGCGVCVKPCPKDALSLKNRDIKIITPVDSVHKTVQIAIEKGKLHDLIFDNRALFNHRLMAAILGAILKLPPIKQILASKQVKSNYLKKLIQNSNF